MSPPHFPEASGSFSVDYRNDDGTIILGQGAWSFETQWSNSGSGSIHAYNDGSNIRELGVPSGACDIEDLSIAVIRSTNFSSRTRSPKAGQVVLWRNTQNYLAATAVRRVSASDEGEQGTELLADYRILTNREPDFASPKIRRASGVLQSVAEARSALARATSDTITVGESTGRVIGIGHNQPPQESSPDGISIEQLRSDLDSVEVIVTGITAVPDADRYVDRLRHSEQIISSWVVRRIEEIASSAAKVIGGVAGAYLLSRIGDWGIVAAKFKEVASALATFLGGVAI